MHACHAASLAFWILALSTAGLGAVGVGDLFFRMLTGLGDVIPVQSLNSSSESWLGSVS